jgi:hypothetical protein
MHSKCPSHLTHFDLITLTVFGEGYESWSYPLCSLPLSPVASFTSGPNIFLSTLFAHTFKIYSSQ